MTHNIIKTENYLLAVSDEIHVGHLPLNNSPVLEGVPLLPPLEDEVKYNFAEMFYGILKTTYPEFDEWVEAKEYNKAKEKYKYTEEDLMEAMLQISEYYADNLDKDMDGHKKSLDIIQSLQQPKMPVAFECEVERIYPNPQTISKEYDFDDILIERKTTTNSQGQTVWVGKYIY